ncbi:hypothetical protein TorRG33x02_083850 [Trema orientale]|uniref:Uncharacterized protein n=1 Tax=Trema orientale TaxID=63057 RepID=A0A2P5FDJ2_TREOI|nr:hypothetical protein TorRG33x02_083850 [Trema orientale]
MDMRSCRGFHCDRVQVQAMEPFLPFQACCGHGLREERATSVATLFERDHRSSNLAQEYPPRPFRPPPPNGRVSHLTLAELLAVTAPRVEDRA